MTAREIGEKISEKTWVPITALALAFAVGVWCAAIQSQTSEAALLANHAHEQVEADGKKLMEALSEIKVNIAIIKEKTESIERYVK